MTAPPPDASYTSGDHSFRENDPYARAKYDLTLRWLAPIMKPGDLLYNIGVGGGYFNHLVAPRGVVVVGCEPDPDIFAAAQRSAPVGTVVLNCSLDEFVQDRPPAKLVVMHDVLEHIEDDVQAVRALRSIVEPGGRVVLSVPALASLYGLHDEKLGHFRRYTAGSLRAVIEREFAILRFRWYGMASIPIALVFSRWMRKPYPVSSARSLAGDIYGVLCALESRISEPIGTSIILELAPR